MYPFPPLLLQWIMNILREVMQCALKTLLLLWSIVSKKTNMCPSTLWKTILKCLACSMKGPNPGFHKKISFGNEAHVYLNGYVKKIVVTPMHLKKVSVGCALWAVGITANALKFKGTL